VSERKLSFSAFSDRHVSPDEADFILDICNRNDRSSVVSITLQKLLSAKAGVEFILCD